MDTKQVINQRQFSWLASSVITSGGVLTLQNVLIRISQMDSWYSYLLSVFYVFGVASFFAYMTKVYPQKHIFEISKEVLGRFGGTVINLIMLFHFWQIVIRDISSVSRFSTTLLLHNTPLEILILLPCLLLIYFGKSSVEVIARVNDLFYPLFVITVLMMPLLLSNEFYFRLVTPAMTMPIQHVAVSSLLTIGSAGDIFILGAFLHMIYNSNQVRSSIRHGALLGIFLLTLSIFLILVVLGPKMPGNFLYPLYNLVQTIHVTDFLDRVDLIILMIWYPTISCKIIAIYMALLLGISSMMDKRNYPTINKPVALFMMITTYLSFKSTTELLTFSNYSAPIIVLAYQPLVMIILTVAVARKKKKDPSAGHLASDGQPPAVRPSQKMGKLSQRYSYKQWLWFGNTLVALATFCLLTGFIFSRYHSTIGTICAVIFAICMILTTLTTYMEVSLLKQAEASK
ncbi:endospore germination permease [Paenibacillus sp. GCM10023248]|uniref:GerAB/ArcD/ProY family transporter n=1 Tax=Bacillales TaxID=1385 RepID=UPI002379EFA9|nr:MULTISPECIES: endospore germination permease [Bacillales]MDD9266668.1 endospore germination permease [Paenibacillus sp. MAHUQ-63]MDR6883613.1 spore germination protein (amino acid permease) [Bacillus sp. 3255]